MSDALIQPDKAEEKLEMLHDEWSLLGGFELERVFEFKDFASALAFVIKVGELADKADHHPEIQLSWGKVVVSLTTHSAGGLTYKDFELATAIDKLGS